MNIQKQEVLKTLELPSVNSKNTNITDAYFNASFGWVITTTGEGLFLIEKNKKTRQFTEDIFQH